MTESWNIRFIYFNWLYSQNFLVRDIESPQSFTIVCSHMHSVVFNTPVPNDKNLASEGEELRSEFISTLPDIDIDDYVQIYSMGKATIFEVLVALSRKADFHTDMGAGRWFWIFMENLGLAGYSDANYVPRSDARIARILRTFNERRYSSSGKGGLFPLKSPGADQRNIELWYQMSAFLNENDL